MEYKNKMIYLIIYIAIILSLFPYLFITIFFLHLSIIDNVFRFGIKIILILSAVIFLIFHYQNWKFIIKVSRKLNISTTIETHGKAIGYLFIPFFNIYWIFKSFGEIGININLILDRFKISKKIPDSICIILPIFILIGLIPFVGLFFLSIAIFIINPIFMFIIIKRLTDISNTLYKIN